MRPERRRFGAVTDAQFAKNAGHVRGYGPITDEQGPGDLPVARERRGQFPRVFPLAPPHGQLELEQLQVARDVGARLTDQFRQQLAGSAHRPVAVSTAAVLLWRPDVRAGGAPRAGGGLPPVTGQRRARVAGQAVYSRYM